MGANSIDSMIGTALEKIKQMTDVNTIIGKAITTADGTTIIPISKVSYGFGAGGSDFPSKSPKEMFGGGTGAGVTISPVAFVVVSGGEVNLLELSGGESSTAVEAIKAVPELIEKIKEMFKSKKPKEPRYY